MYSPLLVLYAVVVTYSTTSLFFLNSIVQCYFVFVVLDNHFKELRGKIMFSVYPLIYLHLSTCLSFLVLSFIPKDLSFHLVQRTSCSISCNAGLLVMNSLHFSFLSLKCLYFIFSLEGYFCWIQSSRLVDFFFFQQFKIVFQMFFGPHLKKVSQYNK